jgi:hypothetical protein
MPRAASDTPTPAFGFPLPIAAPTPSRVEPPSRWVSDGMVLAAEPGSTRASARLAPAAGGARTAEFKLPERSRAAASLRRALLTAFALAAVTGLVAALAR